MTIDDFKNKIILGDNLDVLRQIPSNTIDLIYTDPPFNTGGTWTTEKASFKDKYNSQNHFIEFLREDSNTTGSRIQLEIIDLLKSR